VAPVAFVDDDTHLDQSPCVVVRIRQSRDELIGRWGGKDVVQVGAHSDTGSVEERRPSGRQPDDHHFGSLLMLAVIAGAFLLVLWVGHEGSLFPPPRVSNPLSGDWQKHVLVSSGYLELGMFDDAGLVLEEIAPEDKNRNEVLGARVNLYMAAKKWDMAAAVASHLVKVEPENEAWWINLAYSVRAPRASRRRKPFCCARKRYIPRMSESDLTLACYACVGGQLAAEKQVRLSRHQQRHRRGGLKKSDA
jgi:hypothetical protein